MPAAPRPSLPPTTAAQASRPVPDAVVVANVVAKLALVLGLILVLIDPHWGNLEGKAPVARAVTYPLVAFVVPVVWAIRGGRSPYPWVADLLLTLTSFSDILGNRLDLYDQIRWFDDAMHLVNSGLFAAALVVLTLPRDATALETLERAVVWGLTASLVWELFEYVSFLTRSTEMPTAYADTLGDLALGLLGSMLAALVVVAVRRRTPG